MMTPILAAGTLHHVNFLEIVRHPWFMSAFVATVGAQLMKFLISTVRLRRPVWRDLIAAGGMPSSHSALVSSIAFAIGFTEGFDAPYAMIAFGLGFLVLVDAVTLRRASGEHARLLNRLVHHLNNINDDMRLVYSVCNENRTLNVVFANPAIREGKKVAILQDLFASRVSKVTMLFLSFVVRKRRAVNLRGISNAFIELYRKDRNIMLTELVTASEPDSAILDTVSKVIGEYAHKEIELHNSIMAEYRAAKEINRKCDAVIDMLKIINLGAAIAFIISFI